MGCGGWAVAGLVWGEGRLHRQQLAPTSTQPHLRSGDELAVQDLREGVAGQWPMIWLCEDIVAKTIHITPWPQWYLTPKPHLRSGDELAMLLYIIFREGMGMSSANLLVTFWGQCGKRYTHHPHPSPTLHTYLGFWDKHWTVWFSQWWLVVISVCYFPPLFSLFGQCVMRFYIRFVKLYKMFAMHFNSCRMMGKVEGALGWKFL